MDRRRFLALGCSAAASPLLTPVALAAAPWEERLVVIILRGGMDGIDVVRPLGDPGLAALRPGITEQDGPGTDGIFALHPALDPLAPLWTAGEMAAMHAVSTPYRDRRSHFDGQDILEAGTERLSDGGLREGWLNRMLQAVPGITAETAFAVSRDRMLLATGDAPVARWTPEAELDLSSQARRLLDLVHHGDPLFRDASAEAIALAEALRFGAPPEVEDGMEGAVLPLPEPGQGPHQRVARFAAERLRGQTRIAAFSINGWDTHADQDRTLPRVLGQLSDVILTLRAGLGPHWSRTAVVAMTEFGRTARRNGSRGTDHGTGGAMLLFGGAVRGGRVAGDWPGLGEGALYAGRDLMPTRDVRAGAAWLMRELLGLDRATLEQAVFPGLDMGDNPGLLA